MPSSAPVKISMLDGSEPEPEPQPAAGNATAALLKALGGAEGVLGSGDPQELEQLLGQLGGADAVEAAAQSMLGAMALSGDPNGSEIAQEAGLGGPAESEVAQVQTADDANRLSTACCRLLQGGVGGLDPMAAHASTQVAREILHAQDAPGAGGKHKTALLPSGIVLHYREWGKESSPPIVLLHDAAENHRAWDGVAAAACARFRVLCVDLRGHGQTSRSPRRLYSLVELIGDLHELVVKLSLNGRDWEGAYTRPWVLGGRGTGAAVACNYAARNPGRVAGLFLVDYDPAWPKDRLAFWRYQCAHFHSLSEAAAALNAVLGLRSDPRRIGRQIALRTVQVDDEDERRGTVLAMDPHFFVDDLEPHAAHRDLRTASFRCHTHVVHDGGGGAWPRERADALRAQLEAEGALSATSAGVEASSFEAEAKQLGGVLDEFASLVDADGARNARAARAKAPPPPPPGSLVARAPSPELSEELRELKEKGGDLKRLAALGRADRAALKARLRELGYKGMRVRVKIEEELLQL